MTLPKKEEKGYLQLEERSGKIVLIARKEHAAELVPLFQQNGCDCRNEGHISPDEDRLVFGQSVGRAEAGEILEAYKTAKGS
jgi:hypothetical protein